jgi:hypothetical protein
MSRTRRAQSKRWFRRPHTQSERRQVDAALIEGVHVRPARNARHIPTAREDIPVSASYELDHHRHV